MNDRSKPLETCVFAHTSATCSRCGECPTDDNTRPWYRQRWPWLLLILPALALLACLITLVIAIQHGDSRLHDDYFREGLALRRDSERDRAAIRHHLSADLDIDAKGKIHLRLNNQENPPRQLTLQLQHPFDAHGDCTIPLHLIDGQYQGSSCAHSGRFIVEVFSPSAHWRLRGRITLPLTQTLHLQP